MLREPKARLRHAARPRRGASLDKAAAPEGEVACRPPGPASPLTVLLALYSLLEDGPTASLGMTLAELRGVWPCSGLSDAELDQGLARALASQDFELIRTGADERIRAGNFENRILDPKNLGEIQNIVEAYLDLAAHRRNWALARRIR